MNMLNAVVVDRHPLTRLAVKILLEQNGVDIAGESDDGSQAFSMIVKTRPDIVITDTDIKSISGIELVEKLRQKKFSRIIIVTSAKNGSFYSRQSAGAGANGFVSKKDFVTNIMECINVSRNGYSYYPFSLTSPMDERDSENDMLKSLSSQEVKVMNALLSGIGNKEVAYRMGISHKTVSTYKKRLLEKLACKTTFELLEFATRNAISFI